jgi:outer membrane protein insertion porin family
MSKRISLRGYIVQNYKIIKVHFIFVIFFVVVTFVMCNETGTNLISNFSISGLYNVEQKKILDVIKLKNNKIYSVDAAEKDIHSILKLGYFNDVKVNYDNNSRSILFTVVEKPYIEKIIFKGNYKFTDHKLKNISLLKEKKYCNLHDFNETEKKFLSLYRKYDYIDCKVDTHYSVAKDTNKMTIIFTITENKVDIGSAILKEIRSIRREIFLMTM